MATTGATGSTRVDAPRAAGVRGRIAERNHETKAALKTTEFWAMIALVVAILISAALIDGGDNGTDEFIARNAWLDVSILGAGYFISRGLAKSGSYEPDADYNPIDLSERSRDRSDNPEYLVERAAGRGARRMRAPPALARSLAVRPDGTRRAAGPPTRRIRCRARR